jgi:mRNA interferase HigB
MQKLEITNMNELKEVFPNASIIEDNRIVFNICGNRYRLVVRIVFEFKVIQIKWFGKHNEYDRINAGKINFN